jgi:hypothetical protein
MGTMKLGRLLVPAALLAALLLPVQAAALPLCEPWCPTHPTTNGCWCQKPGGAWIAISCRQWLDCGCTTFHCAVETAAYPGDAESAFIARLIEEGLAEPVGLVEAPSQ